MDLLRRCVAEFIGTFAIVLAGCGAVAINEISGGAITHVGIATTFGLVVMTMIFALGHISMAHFNPAVSIAFASVGKFPWREVGPFIGAQCLGAITASLVHVLTLPGDNLNLGVTRPIDDRFMTAFVWEILLTFFLMLVIMAVATDARASGVVAGLAIGGVVWFDAMFAGPLQGASMNPARSLGPALVSGEFSHLLAYILGPILGAIGAAFCYQFIRGDEK